MFIIASETYSHLIHKCSLCPFRSIQKVLHSKSITFKSIQKVSFTPIVQDLRKPFFCKNSCLFAFFFFWLYSTSLLLTWSWAFVIWILVVCMYIFNKAPGYYLHLNCLQTVFINSLFLTTSITYTRLLHSRGTFFSWVLGLFRRVMVSFICWVSSTLKIKFLLEEIPGWKIKKHITTILHCSVFIISLSRQVSVWG